MSALLLLRSKHVEGGMESKAGVPLTVQSFETLTVCRGN